MYLQTAQGTQACPSASAAAFLSAPAAKFRELAHAVIAFSHSLAPTTHHHSTGVGPPPASHAVGRL